MKQKNLFMARKQLSKSQTCSIKSLFKTKGLLQRLINKSNYRTSRKLMTLKSLMTSDARYEFEYSVFHQAFK